MQTLRIIWSRILGAASGLIAVVAAASAVAPATVPEPAPLRRVQTIPLAGTAGRLDHMALDPVHHRLFVANMPNSSLDVVDLARGIAGPTTSMYLGDQGAEVIKIEPPPDGDPARNSRDVSPALKGNGLLFAVYQLRRHNSIILQAVCSTRHL